MSTSEQLAKVAAKELLAPYKGGTVSVEDCARHIQQAIDKAKGLGPRCMAHDTPTVLTETGDWRCALCQKQRADAAEARLGDAQCVLLGAKEAASKLREENRELLSERDELKRELAGWKKSGVALLRENLVEAEQKRDEWQFRAEQLQRERDRWKSAHDSASKMWSDLQQGVLRALGADWWLDPVSAAAALHQRVTDLRRRLDQAVADQDKAQERSEAADQRVTVLEGALREAIETVEAAPSGRCGGETLHTPQVSDRTLTRWKEALNAPTESDAQQASREAQRRSFAYGNVSIDNPDVTRQVVDEVADAQQEGQVDQARLLWDGEAEWSQATFGSDAERGPEGPIKHLKAECDEVLANPRDAHEYADCLLLIFDAARRSGQSFDSLMAHAHEKLRRNRERKWPTPTSSTEPVMHLKPDAQQEGEQATDRPASMLDRLRNRGWSVAIHNDYRQDGQRHTFYLLTHPDGRWVKAEGQSDRQCIEELLRLTGKAPTPTPTSEPQQEGYYILSLSHSPASEMAVWWRPDNAGYTIRIDDAGVYTREQIEADPRYYDNDVETRAVKVSDAQACAVRVVDESTAFGLEGLTDDADREAKGGGE